MLPCFLSFKTLGFRLLYYQHLWVEVQLAFHNGTLGSHKSAKSFAEVYEGFFFPFSFFFLRYQLSPRLPVTWIFTELILWKLPLVNFPKHARDSLGERAFLQICLSCIFCIVVFVTFFFLNFFKTPLHFVFYSRRCLHFDFLG